MGVLDQFFTRHRKHHSHTSYLTFARGAIGLMLDPENTHSVFDMDDGLRNNDATRELLRFTIKSPAVQSIVDERYLQPGVPDTQRLRQMPEGSLGERYTTHLDSMGFDPDYYRKIDVKDDIDYIMMRIRQTHDIWHVVTGFDTHPLGEICIKAVELAQTHRPMAAAICAGSVFRYIMHEPEHFGYCIESIAAGYHLGLRSGPLLAMKWEEMCDRPVTDIRKDLNLLELGPHGGELTMEFGPGFRAPIDKAGVEEVSKALAELIAKHPEVLTELNKQTAGEHIHTHTPKAPPQADPNPDHYD